MRLQRAIAFGFAFALLPALSGCSSAPPADTDDMSLREIQQLETDVRGSLVDCLLGKGWDVTADEQGYGVDNLPSAQVEQYQADNEECMRETGADQIEPPTLTDERLAEFYSHEEETADCLRARGHEIPQLPSLQTFADGYRQGNPWSAYAFIETSVSEDEWNVLIQACPQL